MIHEVPGTAIKFYLREDYDTDLVVVNEIWQDNVYEVNHGRFSPNGIVVDIGANIGTFSVFAACQGAIVYAVEPEPNNIKSLLKNIDLNRMNSRIIHLPYAISDKKGIANISDEGGGSTIKDDLKLGTKVEMMPLNSLFKLYDIDSVDVLKIDVEGSEGDIILHASKDNLNKCKYITMEFDNRSDIKLGEMTQKLSETHHVRTMGSWERGGMIFAWLY